MKKTKLYNQHLQHQAKMVDFAGFTMPIQYPSGIIAEHEKVRTAVGVFDVSHMGEFIVKGDDALAYIQKLTTNDASKLEQGKAQYSSMCLTNGGIVDDLLVYHCGDYYMLVVNGANIDKDFAWAKQNTAGFSVSLTDESDEYSLLAVQGPKSIETLQKLTTIDLSAVAYYSFVNGEINGIPVIYSRTGYTGEIGFEVYFKGDESVATKVWDAIFAAGEEFGIAPIGLGARDTLRLEKGYCLYGNDITEQTNPLEAGLGWITKLAKGAFNGSDVIQDVKNAGVQRKLVGFKVLTEKFIPRNGYEIVADGAVVGTVTSGSLSPNLGYGIGLGYVATALSSPGSIINISARNKLFEAEVVKIPFL